MAKHESQIQADIIEAVKHFFSSGDYGAAIARERIRVLTPASGGQATTIEDFGRKPYDVGIYAMNTIVLFFEIKERQPSGAINEFKPAQHRMLVDLGTNGIDVRYAYNSWTFNWREVLSPKEILQQAHVRHAGDMTRQLTTTPLAPAQILERYLAGTQSGGHKRLVDILDTDIEQLDNLNSMPLMILINLDPHHAQIIIDLTPKKSLDMMKRLFNLPVDQRADEIDAYLSKNNEQLASAAQAIFALKDDWVGPSPTSSKPGM